MNFEDLPECRKSQCLEVFRDKDGYSASKSGSSWSAAGEDAFFKIMLAVRMDVSVEAISDSQVSEFRVELANDIQSRRIALGRLWQEKSQGGVQIDDLGAIDQNRVVDNVSSCPINVAVNPVWVDPNTKMTTKYAPVIVSMLDKAAISGMQTVLHNRIRICRQLAMDRNIPGESSWFSFVRGEQLHEPHLHCGTVPMLVISGGSANKLTMELNNSYNLAWHPKNMHMDLLGRAEPVYLLVHKSDYITYASAMKELLEQNKNLYLIGWDGGALTGFGPARAAALAFADTLPYRPQRIRLMDQDVVKTEQTRHTNPIVERNIEAMHKAVKSPIAAYGAGNPLRQPVPLPFEETLPPEGELDTPAEQFVSIQAPFRQRWNDGIYAPFMVAGGEDKLATIELGLINGERNSVLPDVRIIKKELQGPSDAPNIYWNEKRVETLKALFEVERHTLLNFEGEVICLDGLMSLFESRGWVAFHPSPESYNIAACVIERIILKLRKELAKESSKFMVYNFL